MRLILTLAVAAGLAGCASSRRSEAISVAVARWNSCVGTAHASNRANGMEKNLAVEGAFAACRTEDDAIAALFATDPDSYVGALRIIAAKKAETKARLVAN